MTRKRGYITAQAKRLGAGEINRRRFVMQALSAGVTLPTAMSLATRAQASTPHKGGNLRVATTNGLETQAQSPVQGAATLSDRIAALRFNRLTEPGRDGRIAPALAETIEASSDHKTWAFNLRPGVTFHNGQPLAPADVIASLDRFRDSLLADVSDLRQDGDAGVLITLAHADVSLARRLSDPRLAILPTEDGRFVAETAGGTGGYVLRDNQPGTTARFERNETYWRPHAAHFDSIELVAIPESNTRHHAVMNGEFHFAEGIDRSAVGFIRTMPTLEVLETPGNRPISFPVAFGVTKDHKQLLLALKYALRRQELIDRILLGHGRIGDDTPTAPLEALTCCFDPERAADHYRRSGHTGAITLGPPAPEFAGQAHAARLIASSAASAGIAIEVSNHPIQPDAHLFPAWPNDIAAHARTLTRAAGFDPLNFEYWWFA